LRAGGTSISTSAAITFKGKSIDAKEIEKELGVRYVLEGSVQRDQNRVRVNAQLVDAAFGAQSPSHFELVEARHNLDQEHAADGAR
jgi:TolB-like protein